MKHLFALLFSLAYFTLGASAQKAGTVEHAIKNLQRETESGKADVYLHQKRQVAEAPVKSKKSKAAGYKRKRTCGTPTAATSKN